MSFSAPGVRESKPVPKYGPVPRGLPFVPMIWAWSEMSPIAAPTCGTARTLAQHGRVDASASGSV